MRYGDPLDLDGPVCLTNPDHSPNTILDLLAMLTHITTLTNILIAMLTHMTMLTQILKAMQTHMTTLTQILIVMLTHIMTLI